MIEQITEIIEIINTQEFGIGFGFGIVIIILIFQALSIFKKRRKKDVGLNILLKKLYSIGENLKNSQKENIKAHKELNELYEIVKELGDKK